MTDLNSILTEQRNPLTKSIDTLPTLDMVRMINREDHQNAKRLPLRRRGNVWQIHGVGVDAEKFPVNIEDHGNSSSASCPILLDECHRKGLFKPGDKIMFSAFGAGLMSGVALLEW